MHPPNSELNSPKPQISINRTLAITHPLSTHSVQSESNHEDTIYKNRKINVTSNDGEAFRRTLIMKSVRTGLSEHKAELGFTTDVSIELDRVLKLDSKHDQSSFNTGFSMCTWLIDAWPTVEGHVSHPEKLSRAVLELMTNFKPSIEEVDGRGNLIKKQQVDGNSADLVPVGLIEHIKGLDTIMNYGSNSDCFLNGAFNN
ncbi:hypothetical protein ScalyP_jg4840 [Parmales sp. scaly parma]|nr:hypothetical protein ScalyP_jg4840 [Parmales sp. scaly parma]